MRAAFAALLALCLAAPVAAVEPQGDTGAHDPTLLIQGDRWFVFTTGKGLQRLESTDQGKTWRRLAPIFKEAPAWWAEAVPEQKALDIWAPKVFQHAGRTWVLYSISTFGKNRSAIGLASSATPDGSDWRDDGLVVQSVATDNFNAIDPDLFVDRDGKLWMSFGSFWGGLRVTQLDAKTLKPTGPTRFIARSPAIEAPTIVRRGDWVYLFASYDLCCKGAESTYNVRVGRSRSVTGPYLDRDGKDLMDAGGTQLLAATGTRWKGPGHQDVVGDLMVHHAYDTERGGRPHLRIAQLSWSADGWPQIKEE
ncbi:arabinan endo-1,5-alpha-L-arabinosidase [Roseateles asaccharophilus]|uniref:Arabinan endo-1,5-alpha-L-arabinosidase n=1 Tax=Roseateles asaccharophilus TaxID=582607 RepID=A0ABU2AAF1_9BURK|nr:arabinan endo-1,5-alpha-L-arabinosidase [Roseateles asaccharophilus]MDR7333447.1 arabinan endo-1,5-alpha-L-arabinosidase [Roseateles asaccharophilus]